MSLYDQNSIFFAFMQKNIFIKKRISANSSTAMRTISTAGVCSILLCRLSASGVGRPLLFGASAAGVGRPIYSLRLCVKFLIFSHFLSTTFVSMSNFISWVLSHFLENHFEVLVVRKQIHWYINFSAPCGRGALWEWEGTSLGCGDLYTRLWPWV